MNLFDVSQKVSFGDILELALGTVDHDWAREVLLNSFVWWKLLFLFAKTRQSWSIRESGRKRSDIAWLCDEKKCFPVADIRF